MPDLFYYLCIVTGYDISQNKETFEVLLDYTKIGVENIKGFVKEAIRNILHAKIDAHSIRLITGFPGDGVKCVSKIQ